MPRKLKSQCIPLYKCALFWHEMVQHEIFLKKSQNKCIGALLSATPHVLPRVPPAEACEHATCASPPTHRTGTGTRPHHLFDLVLNKLPISHILPILL